MLKKFWKDESGQGMVEYALIIALIAIALVVALGLVKTALSDKFTDVKDALNEAGVEPED